MHITKFVIHITKFVTHVRNFVTNFFCADSKKYQAERGNYLPDNKKRAAQNFASPAPKSIFWFYIPRFLHFVSIKQGQAQPLNFAKLLNLCYYAPFRRFRVFLNKAKPFVNKAKMKVADIEKVTNAPIVHIERTTTVLGLHYSFLSTSRIIT